MRALLPPGYAVNSPPALAMQLPRRGWDSFDQPRQLQCTLSETKIMFCVCLTVLLHEYRKYKAGAIWKPWYLALRDEAVSQAELPMALREKFQAVRAVGFRLRPSAEGRSAQLLRLRWSSTMGAFVRGTRLPQWGEKQYLGACAHRELRRRPG